MFTAVLTKLQAAMAAATGFRTLRIECKFEQAQRRMFELRALTTCHDHLTHSNLLMSNEIIELALDSCRFFSAGKDKGRSLGFILHAFPIVSSKAFHVVVDPD